MSNDWRDDEEPKPLSSYTAADFAPYHKPSPKKEPQVPAGHPAVYTPGKNPNTRAEKKRLHEHWAYLCFVEKRSHAEIAEAFHVSRRAITKAMAAYAKAKPQVKLGKLQEVGPLQPKSFDKEPEKLRLVKTMRETLNIRDKDAQIVSFIPNKAQRRLDSIVVICEKLEVAAIIEILKSRQKGFSTRIEGYIYTWAKKIPNTEALLAANMVKNTKKVFRITKRFHTNDPDTPETGSKFKQDALEYPENHGSRIDIVTAETEDAGASGTTNRVHNSEFGLFNKAADYWATLYPAWPARAGSMIFNESTGRHDAIAFKEMFDAAFRHDPEHPIETYKEIKRCRDLGVVAHISLFEHWLDDEEAEIPLSPHESFDTLGMDWGDKRGLDDKERELAVEFPVLRDRPEKMKWFHQQYLGMKRNWARMMTEYPLKSEHPFLFWGGPAYNQVILNRLLEECLKKTPVFRGEIDFDSDYATGKPKLERNEFGHLFVYEDPLPNYLYVIGLDCAQGTGSGDYNEIVVVRVPKANEKRKVVAHWRTNERGVGPGMAAVTAWLLAKHYGKFGNIPLMIPERQAINVAAIEKLLEGHPLFPKMTAPYPLIFSYIQLDRDTHEPREEYGFQTTQTAKESSIENLALQINADLYEIESEMLIRQLIGFSEDPLKKGRGRWVQRFIDPETKKPNDDGESALRMANYGVDWVLDNDIPVLERIG